MSGFMKGLLTALGILAVLALLVVGAGAWFVSPALSSAKAGEAFGHDVDQLGCEGEALNRFADCGDGVRCIMGAATFHTMCLQTATASPNYCGGIPDMESADIEAWAVEACTQVELPNSDGCQAIMGVTAAMCDTGQLPSGATVSR